MTTPEGSLLGRRVQWPDDMLPSEIGELLAPGDYVMRPGGAFWLLRAPNGDVGLLSGAEHTVEEHEDGTISVEPSLAYRGKEWHLDFPGHRRGWHGWLRHGVWSEA